MFVNSLGSTPGQHAKIFTKHIDRDPLTGETARAIGVYLSVGAFTRRFELVHREANGISDIARRCCELPAADRIERLGIEHELLSHLLGRDIRLSVLKYLIIRIPLSNPKSFWPVAADDAGARGEALDGDAYGQGMRPPDVQLPARSIL